MVRIVLAAWVFVAAAQTAPPSVPGYGDFPVRGVFRGSPAVPILASSEARRFRTELRRQAASGPNFGVSIRLPVGAAALAA